MPIFPKNGTAVMLQQLVEVFCSRPECLSVTSPKIQLFECMVCRMNPVAAKCSTDP